MAWNGASSAYDPASATRCQDSRFVVVLFVVVLASMTHEMRCEFVA